ncbi:helix-turn-helix transcriptional regulator [Gemmatimonas sp.]|uniref:helix-turn-helix transcriptional regulator n=1 Tax=Gemmatimonas sp. TaxID=1962908 RepID=UPI0039835AA4
MGTATLSTLPFTGRRAELDVIERARVAAGRGLAQLLLLSGDGGIGKTRLVQEAAMLAAAAGWQVVTGRAYPLETAIPYALFGDALEPLFAALDSAALTRLTRGDKRILSALTPRLLAEADLAQQRLTDGVTLAEQRLRLHTGILQMLGRLSERQPLMLCLENLQWADSSSIELLHFVSRQLGTDRVLLVASWNESDRPLNEELRLALRSLRTVSMATDVRLIPLSRDDVASLLSTAFDVERDAVKPFATLLQDSTRGNPFFVDQTLRELVSRGELRQQGGVWVGWHVEQLVLPPSVRELLLERLGRLSVDARVVSDVIAVIGTTAAHDVVRSTSGLSEDALRLALGELRGEGIVTEESVGSTITYDLAHPMMRQTLVAHLGLARERDLHARIAVAIESVAGRHADREAESIAAHWRKADPRMETARSVKWLLQAGRQALGRLARREAAITLRASLDRIDEHLHEDHLADVPMLLDELARLYRRLGEYHEAIAMCARASALADARGDNLGVAVAERRLGLAQQGLGRREDAIRHFDVALARAGVNHSGNGNAQTEVLLARIRLAKGDCLQALGLPEEAKLEITHAVEIAERLGQVPLLARAHRMLLMVHLWSGPAHRAWAHARSAVELAEQSGERNLAWSAHWSAAVLAALTAHTGALEAHLKEATRLAAELNSPLLELRTMEIMIEYRAGTGEWDRAIMDGERAIAMGRALDQTTLLARLLYWVSGVYLQRGDFATAKRLIDDAWEVSGAANLDLDRPFEVHGVLPACVARTAYLSAVGEHAQALALGQTAIAIADRTGYIAWAVYRLLPTLAEAALAVGDDATLSAVRRRLEHDATHLAHPIGAAWVLVIDGADALREERTADAILLLQRAVATLEAVPYPFDAARTRLRLARALQQSGALTEAKHEAREALQMLERLGARPAAEEARTVLRSLGGKVAADHQNSRLATLTPREFDILRLVAQRLSNKEIGTRLGITARTAGTHLANIFDKLDVRDRTALGDMAREQGLHRAT